MLRVRLLVGSYARSLNDSLAFAGLVHWLYDLPTTMKLTDDYKAKIKLWAANPRVLPMPGKPSLPRFGAMKFRSHLEMNRWKEELLRRLAREGKAHG